MVHWNKQPAVHARYAVLFIWPLLIVFDPMVYVYLHKDISTGGGQGLLIPIPTRYPITSTGSLLNPGGSISGGDTTKGEGSWECSHMAGSSPKLIQIIRSQIMPPLALVTWNRLELRHR